MTVSGASRKLRDQLRTAGPLSTEDAAAFLLENDCPQKDIKFGLLYGLGKRHWWEKDGNVLYAIPTSVSSTAPGQDQPAPLPAEEIAALESPEAQLRALDQRLGIAEKQAAATAAFIASTVDMNSPIAVWGALGLCSELGLSQRKRLALSWCNLMGVQIPTQLRNVLTEASESAGATQSFTPPQAQEPPTRKRRLFGAMNGAVIPLDNDTEPDEGLPLFQATMVAESQRQAMKDSRPVAEQPSLLDQLTAFLDSRLGKVIMEKLTASANPSGVLVKLGDSDQPLPLDAFERLADIQNRNANGKMMREAVPEFMQLGGDMIGAMKRMMDREDAAAELSEPPTPAVTTGICVNCGSVQMIPEDNRPWVCDSCSYNHHPEGQQDEETPQGQPAQTKK